MLRSSAMLPDYAERFRHGGMAHSVQTPRVIPTGSSDSDKNAAIIAKIRPDRAPVNKVKPANKPKIPHSTDSTIANT